MRLIAGAWRGRALVVPAGQTTRPTADRVRQSLFDMIRHAPWGGRNVLEGAMVVDAFAGTGAMGLEALSRGAASAVFMERDAAALAALRANIAACRAGDRARVVAGDVLHPPQGSPAGIVFLDPPYGEALIGPALAALRRTGWLAPGGLVVAETSRLDSVENPGTILARRAHGAASLMVWREAA